tara:strand:+ start:224 stop:517 length:294 start_codon:yes stop_codon:yes gene_type:complete
MRVKIAYTVELEEIESEVGEILHRSLLNMEHALEESQNAVNHLETGDSDISTITNILDLARRKLAKADMIIADCHEILIGYKAALEKIQEEAENEEF